MRALDTARTMMRGGWLLLLSTTLGCGVGDAILRNDYSSSSTGAGGSGGGTSTATGPLCDGQCAPLGPGEWLGPMLVWVGKPGEAPECPPSAPVAGDLGFADPSAPTVCGACSCDPPKGSCTIPTTWTAANATCAGEGPGATHTSFDAPAGWSGGCIAKNPIAAGQKCNGVNCVQSLTIAPLALVESGCGAASSSSQSFPLTWGTAARSCHGVTEGACEGPGELCVPAAEPGYLRCLARDGDYACPAPYTDAHHFFTGVDDTRSCSPCACGAPVGSTCTALVTAYSDGACSTPIASVTIDATKAACVDILPSGAALGSKLAEEPVYGAGTCKGSGGEPTGAVVPINPITICCLP